MLNHFVDRVVQHALRNPDAPAVRANKTTLKYCELSCLIGDVERKIRSFAKSEDIICFDPDAGALAVASILGIWLSGKTPFPYPKGEAVERISHIVRVSGARVQLAWRGQIPSIHELPSEPISGGTSGWEVPAAYLLFTSGSTGKPKGVLLPGESLAMLADWHGASKRRGGRILAVAPFTFDVSYQALVTALSSGGLLVLPVAEQRQSPQDLIELITEMRVEGVFLPPVLLSTIAQACRARPDLCPDLRDVYAAGEALKITPDIKTFFYERPQCRLHNHYGPTETHVVTSLTLPADVADWPALPGIGEALPGVFTRVVDEDGADCGPQEVGELHVGGRRVAHGYVGAPTEAGDRFFVRDGVRWYRTGDLVLRDAEGFRFLGRNDRQMKVSGYRIEPLEIENALESCADVVTAVVATSHGSEDVLVAYVRPRYGLFDGELPMRVFSPPWLEELHEKLPRHLIPAVWVVVDKFVLTSNGKVDYQALHDVAAVHVMPANATVSAISNISNTLETLWAEALRLPSVPPHINFFDLGGTSLIAAKLSARMSDAFGRRISPISIFEHSTLEAFTKFLSGKQGDVLGATTVVQSIAEADHGIAIVGMSCRFPGAETLADFWSNIEAGLESISHTGSAKGEGRVAAAGLIRDIDRFDAELFGIPPQEAILLDPQHRKFLECTWEALEDACVDPKAGGADISIFGGCGPSSYLLNNLHSAKWRPDRSLLDSAHEAQLLMGNDKDFFTLRVAYSLNLGGKAYNVNAACATSLVAVQLACEDLRAGASNLAIAGAACIPVPQLGGHKYEPDMPFSPDGHCRPFDERAAGTVFGSGVGVVVLKRLSDAKRDRDDVYAVIRGGAVNNDGSDKVGFAAPSVSGQERVIRSAIAAARVSPKTINYVEAHGTATSVGDPIEILALSRAYGVETRQTCGIGSVKSNIGHLGWAAGMAGLIKTALSLRNRKIPKTLHYNSENPLLNLADTPFFVVSEQLDLSDSEIPLRAGVSAFGVGGANAHLVLEEADRLEAPGVTALGAKCYLPVPFSGLDDDALARNLTVLSHETVLDDMPISDVVSTLGAGRRHLPKRAVVIARTGEDLRAALPFSDVLFGRRQNKVGKIGALFSGHGSEYAGMSRVLYQKHEVFRDSVDAFDKVVTNETGRTVAQILFDGEKGKPIQDVVDAHIAVYTVGLALFDLWTSWGVHFGAISGHSLGEYPAAAAAGIFDRQHGLQTVIRRGRLVEGTPANGAMAVVRGDADEVLDALVKFQPEVGIGAANSHSNTVISGSVNALTAAAQHLKSLGLSVIPLKALRAGHSSLMAPIKGALVDVVSRMDLNASKIPLVGNVTGEVLGADEIAPEYWGEHLCRPVQFRKSLQTLSSRGIGTFIEIGGDPVLLSIVAEELADEEPLLLPSLRRKSPDDRIFAETAGAIYRSGYDLNWRQIAGGSARRRHLPGYSFARKRHWVEPPVRPSTDSRSASPESSPEHRDARDCGYITVWKHLDVEHPIQRQPGTKWLIVNAGGCEEVSEFGAILEAKGVDVAVVDLSVLTGPEEIVERLDQSPGLEVVFFGCRALPEESDMPGEAIIDILASAACSVADWMRALSNWTTSAKTARFWQVSRAAWSVVPDDGCDPTQTIFGALAQTATLELSDVETVAVDLPVEVTENSLNLLAEMLIVGSKESHLAIREDKVLCRRLQALDVRGRQLLISEAGINLVTGGLGGIGLSLANELISRGARHIVLAGRNAPSAEQMTEICRQRKRGATVEAISLDVVDTAAVDAWFKTVADAGQKVTGIYHLAGVLSDKQIVNLSKADFVEAISPKSGGGWNLHRACERYSVEPRQFVLFSSATAMIGNVGQGNYAVANAFLDGLAHYRRARGRPALSVNWGVWGDVGYVARHPDLQHSLEMRGMGTLHASGCFEALFTALNDENNGCFAQIGFLPNNWSHFLSFNNLQNRPLFSDVAQVETFCEGGASELRTSLTEVPKGDRKALLTKWLSGAVSGLTPDGFAPEPDADLRDSNLDSLSLIQLRNRLKRDLRLDLPSQLIARYQTIDGIANFIAELIADKGLPTEGDALANVEPNPSGQPRMTVQQKRWLSLSTRANYGHRVVPVTFQLPLCPGALRETVLEVVSRHPVLRYVYSGEFPKVLDAAEVVPEIKDLLCDLRGQTGDSLPLSVRAEVCEMRRNVPDPRRYPSWQLKCLWLSDEHFCLLVGAQHLELDGSGLSVLIDEINRLYRARIGIDPACILTAPIPYSDYARTQQEYFADGLEQDRAFFEGMFNSLEHTSSLSDEFPLFETRALPSERFTPEHPLVSRDHMRRAERVLKVSPAAILLATYAKLVSDLTGNDTVTIALIRSSRIDERYARTIGPFTMPFPLPVHVGRKPSLELVHHCESILTAVAARADYPSTDLLDRVKAFEGLPYDTYFTDFGLNFTNYRAVEKEGAPGVQIVEVLGKVSEPEFAHCDFGKLTRVPGFHVVAQMSDAGLVANYWYHTDRVPLLKVKEWAQRHAEIMHSVLGENFGTADESS